MVNRTSETTTTIISGANVPSYGQTPQRVYSLANGGGYATKRCRKCHAEFRVRESEPCKPGHMSAVQLDPQSFEKGKRVEVKHVLPLGSEYMYHRGTKGYWSLPVSARKIDEVQGECQGIKRAVHKRIDDELCRKCYVELLKKIASGKSMGKEVLTVTRRRGKIVHRNVVDIKPSAELVSIARLEVKRSRSKTAKAPAKLKPGHVLVDVTETERKVVFATTHWLPGADIDDRPFLLKVEARTLAEARKLFAEAFSLTADTARTLNIYKVEDSGDLNRVA